MLYDKLFEAMVKVGQQKGWRLEPTSELLAAMTHVPVTLRGEESGVRVELARFSAFHTFTTLAYIEPAVPTAFKITSEGVTGAIANSLGIEDVQVGEEKFDATFRIVSKDPDALRRFLTPDVRAVLEELAAASEGVGSHFGVTEQAVSLQRPHFGLMTEEEVLRDVPLIVKVARTLANAAKVP